MKMFLGGTKPTKVEWVILAIAVFGTIVLLATTG